MPTNAALLRRHRFLAVGIKFFEGCGSTFSVEITVEITVTVHLIIHFPRAVHSPHRPHRNYGDTALNSHLPAHELQLKARTLSSFAKGRGWPGRRPAMTAERVSPRRRRHKAARPTGKSISILADVVRHEAPRHTKNHPRQKTNFSSPFNPIPPVQSPCEKYPAFVFPEIGVPCPCPALEQEGRFAIVTNVERGMRWTHRGCSARFAGGRTTLTRTAKPCGPGIPTLMPSSQRRISRLAGDGGNKARSPGRARSKP
jgi:hypothetical protein